MSSFFIGNLKFKVNNWIRFNCIAAALLFSMTILINGCSKKEQIQARPPAPVKTAIAINKDIPVQIEENGTVEAYSTVNITSRVDGHLIEVHVNEGQNVEKGQLLFSLDDRPYKAVLQSAQSNLIRDKIKFEKAQKDAARYTDLIEKDYVTRTMYEQAVADAKSLEAVVKGDEAALENARLNVGYCQITSPISGRAGAVLVNKGNLVKANENKPLIVINQVNPAYVKFAVPEQLLPDIQAQLSAREIEVLAKIPEKSQIIKQGKLTFVDNSVDVKTGTIVLKAMFKNDDHTLWPGQFVNAYLVIGSKKQAVVVPSQSIQISQRGNYVFVVKKDMTVEIKEIKQGANINGMTVIEEGLKPGETVVTDGHLRLVPGAKIIVKNDNIAGGDLKK